MTASNPKFQDPSATRAWDQYFRAVDRYLKPLSTLRRQEIRDELVAHVLDGMDAEPVGDESTRLATVLSRMGTPDSYLEGVVEDAALANETGAGWRFAQGLKSLGRTIGLATTYVLGLMALLLAIGRVFYPAEVGVFRMSSGWIVAGYVDNEGATDLLGMWSIPVMIALLVVFWFVLPRRFDRNH